MLRLHAILLLLTLAIAGIGGILMVTRIERPGSPIGIPQVTADFSPNGDGVRDSALVRFHMRQPDEVRVDIVDAHGQRVRRLLVAERKGPVKLTWNGRDDDEIQVAEGTYRTHIMLTHGRDFDVRSPIRLDLTPPRIDKATADLTIFPKQHIVRVLVAGRGSARRWLEYDGTRLAPLPIRRPQSEKRNRTYRHFRMAGRLPAGEHDLTRLRVVLVDAAGNRAEREVAPPPPKKLRSST